MTLFHRIINMSEPASILYPLRDDIQYLIIHYLSAIIYGYTLFFILFSYGFTIFSGDRHELPKRISELAAQLTGVCHEVLTSRDAIIDCLKVLGTTNEMGETNLASKIREWGVESEALCVLVRTTARKTDRDALSISNQVSELVHQVTILMFIYSRL